MSLDDCVRQAGAALGAADALLVTAGAGMGVDSGLPDFRGPQGFWRAYPAIAKLGLSFEEMATPSWFVKDPHLAWAFYGHRLNLYRATRPHSGFAELLALGRKKANGYFVFTSNVDGQFQKVGFPSDRVVECHGSIHYLQCAAGCGDAIWPAAEEPIRIEESTFRALDPLPHCKHCGALARPNILMFGDPYWVGQRSETQELRFQQWLERLGHSGARVGIIEVGAGTAIPSVRYTSERVARQLSGTLIRVNPREPQVPPGGIALELGAAQAVEQIVRSMQEKA